MRKSIKFMLALMLLVGGVSVIYSLFPHERPFQEFSQELKGDYNVNIPQDIVGAYYAIYKPFGRNGGRRAMCLIHNKDAEPLLSQLMTLQHRKTRAKSILPKQFLSFEGMSLHNKEVNLVWPTNQFGAEMSIAFYTDKTNTIFYFHAPK